MIPISQEMSFTVTNQPYDLKVNTDGAGKLKSSTNKVEDLYQSLDFSELIREIDPEDFNKAFRLWTKKNDARGPFAKTSEEYDRFADELNTKYLNNPKKSAHKKEAAAALLQKAGYENIVKAWRESPPSPQAKVEEKSTSNLPSMRDEINNLKRIILSPDGAKKTTVRREAVKSLAGLVKGNWGLNAKERTLAKRVLKEIAISNEAHIVTDMRTTAYEALGFLDKLRVRGNYVKANKNDKSNPVIFLKNTIFKHVDKAIKLESKLVHKSGLSKAEKKTILEFLQQRKNKMKQLSEAFEAIGDLLAASTNDTKEYNQKMDLLAKDMCRIYMPRICLKAKDAFAKLHIVESDFYWLNFRHYVKNKKGSLDDNINQKLDALITDWGNEIDGLVEELKEIKSKHKILQDSKGELLSSRILLGLAVALVGVATAGILCIFAGAFVIGSVPLILIGLKIYVGLIFSGIMISHLVENSPSEAQEKYKKDLTEFQRICKIILESAKKRAQQSQEDVEAAAKKVREAKKELAELLESLVEKGMVST